MLAPELRSMGRSISAIPAMPGTPAWSSSSGVSAPAMASAMWLATGSTRRRQVGIVRSIHSARLQAAGLPGDAREVGGGVQPDLGDRHGVRDRADLGASWASGRARGPPRSCARCPW